MRFLCCLALIACGGSGSDADAALDSPAPDTPGFDSSFDSGVDAMMPAPGRPTFMLERVALDAEPQIALTQPGETVDMLALAGLELWHMEIGSGSAEAVLTVSESLSPSDPPPSAARAADGTLHIAWEAISVRYATNAGGTWTESEVASNGREVSLALDASGVPHVAFIRLADEVNVARLEGDTWTTEVVGNAPGGIGLPWTGIATEGDRLVLVGTTGEGSFWLRTNDGSGWVDDTIDIGDVVFMGRTGQHTLTAGEGGTLLTFYSNGRYAAFRPAGASAFQVATLGNTFELDLDEPVGSAVGAEGAFIAGRDFGDRLAVVAPGTPFWPLVAAVPWRGGCSSSGNNIALSMDADDDPIMVAWCERELLVFRADGNYPTEYAARCDEAVTALCDQACACGGPDGDACGFFIEGSTNSGNLSGCRLSARETLCSDSTEPFETLTTCLPMLAPTTCDTNGYPVPEACWPLGRL